MNKEAIMDEDEQYVDVNSLPLRPPQPLLPAEKPVRRPWHPVMWDNSIMGIPTPPQPEEDKTVTSSKEYPHKQRIRNLKRLIAQGKVTATPETLIFFLCNKFAISDERQGRQLATICLNKTRKRREVYGAYDFLVATNERFYVVGKCLDHGFRDSESYIIKKGYKLLMQQQKKTESTYNF